MASCNVEQLVETYINGNISITREALQHSCSKKQVLEFVELLADSGYEVVDKQRDMPRSFEIALKRTRRLLD